MRTNVLTCNLLEPLTKMTECEQPFVHVDRLIRDLLNDIENDRGEYLVNMYICLLLIREVLHVPHDGLYESIEADMNDYERNISLGNHKVNERCSLYNLYNKDDLLSVKLYKHREEHYLVCCRTQKLYDLTTFRFVCQWGEVGHETDGFEFPQELIPDKCNDCSSVDFTFTNCPFLEEVYRYTSYGWWCENCIVRAANEI